MPLPDRLPCPIIYIEDNPMDCQLLQAMSATYAPEAWQVLPVDSIEAAAPLVATHAVRLVLLDLQLRSLDRQLLQMDGRLERLMADVAQLDHIVQIPNGQEPLTTRTQRHAMAIEELQRWRTQYDGLLVGLETARVQGASARQVAEVQGWTARSVALLTGALALLTALASGLLVWALTGRLPPRP